MATYLIDYENVNASGLNGIASLGADDAVFILYSANADRITFDLHERINQSKATITTMKVMAGSKNALDFQLITYLGYMIAGKPEESYYIVSNDSGFNTVQKFWKSREIKVELIADIDSQNNEEAQEALEDEMTKLIADSDEAKNVAELIFKYKTKQGINNALVKTYGSKKGGELYQLIRPQIKNKR